jgi:hypothetical protein
MHWHMFSARQGHPLRDVGMRIVGLMNDQEVVIADVNMPYDLYNGPGLRVVWVVDLRFAN